MPAHRLDAVLQNALAIGIHEAKVILAEGMALLGREALAQRTAVSLPNVTEHV